MNIRKRLNASTRLFKFISAIVFLLILLASVSFYKSNQKICVNPFELKDFTSSKERVEICNNTLYKGSIKVVSKDEYPDLFEFTLNSDSKPQEVEQHIRLFKEDKYEYVSVVSFMDYVSWNNSAIGIYRKTNDGYVEIFKRSFSDNQGRWVDVEFGEDYSYRDVYFYLNTHGEGLTISGDIGYLGCYGACRLLWWDYYEWDSKEKTFVLANNKHPNEFQRLLESYEDFDKTKCQDEANVNKSISELYKTRKDKKRICADGLMEPSSTPAQAEMLLKGMRAIKLIIEGENISMDEVSDIKID